MAEIWGAAIAAAGAIGGGIIASNGAKSSAGKSAAGSAAAIAEQQRQYNTTRSDTAPARVIGNQALNALGSIYGYKPAASPLSYDAWNTANPMPAGLKLSGGGGPGSTSLIQATDPLGLYSGGGSSIKRALDPAGLFGGSHTSAPKGPTADQVKQAAYQQYLQNFDYSGTSSAPKTPPGNAFAPNGGGNGVDPASGYRVGPGGSVQQGAATGPVTIDHETGQVIDGAGGSGVQPGAGGATAAGPPQMGGAGPDYSNFFMSPDYTFRRDQGTQGIERTASARGLTGSGNALTALDEYNSNLAAGEFGNYFNRQATLAGIGNAATNTATTAGMNSANNISGSLQSAADARASGVANSADAWGNALGTLSGIAYDRWGRPKKTVGG